MMQKLQSNEISFVASMTFNFIVGSISVHHQQLITTSYDAPSVVLVLSSYNITFVRFYFFSTKIGLTFLLIRDWFKWQRVGLDSVFKIRNFLIFRSPLKQFSLHFHYRIFRKYSSKFLCRLRYNKTLRRHLFARILQFFKNFDFSYPYF